MVHNKQRRVQKTGYALMLFVWKKSINWLTLRLKKLGQTIELYLKILEKTFVAQVLKFTYHLSEIDLKYQKCASWNSHCFLEAWKCDILLLHKPLNFFLFQHLLHIGEALRLNASFHIVDEWLFCRYILLSWDYLKFIIWKVE